MDRQDAIKQVKHRVYNNPVNTIYGPKGFRVFLEMIDEDTYNNILVIASKRGIGNRYDDLIKILTYKNYIYIEAVSQYPNIDNIFSLYKKLKNRKIDYIIAIGGGSVMDTAKILKAILFSELSSKNSLREIVTKSNYALNNIKLILIPTTAGTGSEKTNWATLWDVDKQKKYTVEHDMLYAKDAYVDPEFTYTTPVPLALTFALDAFTHAIEAYWSPYSIDITREYSLSAINLFINNIGFLPDRTNKKSRDYLMLCSVMAANAFSHTKTTICHAISYQFTLKYNIPHGLAAWMTVPYFLKKNSGHFKDEDRLYRSLGVNNSCELKKKIELVMDKANISYKLLDYGFKCEHIDYLVENSFVKGRYDNNPIKVNYDIVKEAIESLM